MASATAISETKTEESASPFAATRDELCEMLVQTTLIESYHSFAQHSKPYPFTTRESLQSGASMSFYEHPFQRSALVVLIDGTLPSSLRKHIRYRRANELTVHNLARLAPEIARDCLPPLGLCIGDEMFPGLLDRLLDVDYALLMQRPTRTEKIALSHMHVKVERLTDNAVSVLARDLGYIRRALNENGEAYSETLEKKFFEYFGFSATASGRKCAAAMAAQLLSAETLRFAVFATCQEDCRLTMLDGSDTITHHLLLPVNQDDLGKRGAENLQDYVIGGDGDNVVVCYRVRFHRTKYARPVSLSSLPRPESGLEAPWLEVTDQIILPLPGHQAPQLSYNWL